MSGSCWLSRDVGFVRMPHPLPPGILDLAVEVAWHCDAFAVYFVTADWVTEVVALWGLGQQCCELAKVSWFPSSDGVLRGWSHQDRECCVRRQHQLQWGCRVLSAARVRCLVFTTVNWAGRDGAVSGHRLVMAGGGRPCSAVGSCSQSESPAFDESGFQRNPGHASRSGCSLPGVGASVRIKLAVGISRCGPPIGGQTPLDPPLVGGQGRGRQPLLSEVLSQLGPLAAPF